MISLIEKAPYRFWYKGYRISATIPHAKKDFFTRRRLPFKREY